MILKYSTFCDLHKFEIRSNKMKKDEQKPFCCSNKLASDILFIENCLVTDKNEKIV